MQVIKTYEDLRSMGYSNQEIERAKELFVADRRTLFDSMLTDEQITYYLEQAKTHIAKCSFNVLENTPEVDIANKLHEYYTIRDETRHLTAKLKLMRIEIAKMAVANGQDQRDAVTESNLGAVIYLDGYLVGKGVYPQNRIFSNH